MDTALVWDSRNIGWIERRKVGLFKKKTRIYFFSLVAGYYDCRFKSEGELESFLSDNLFISQDIVYEKCSVDIIYNYKESETIYFNSKTAQNDWLKANSKNFNIIKNG